MSRFFLCLFGLCLPGCAALATSDEGIELAYIAHACFVIESPSTGTRILIDPYNGYAHNWLGYSFPEGVRADAVLVTHPHYDHDATYYIGGRPLVFREPGAYSVRDIVIQGVEGRHAKGYGRAFGQLNTIWLVEVGGVRIVHLGDNGPLDADVVERLGRVDVLMVPIDADEHILRY